jgi:hypothetical protein
VISDTQCLIYVRRPTCENPSVTAEGDVATVNSHRSVNSVVVTVTGSYEAL